VKYEQSEEMAAAVAAALWANLLGEAAAA